MDAPILLRLVRTDGFDPRRGLGPWLDLLDETERARLARFSAAGAARDFVLGRALVRTMLSRERPRVAPARWRFRENAFGRPEIAEPACRLRFNLSHTAGLIACAVSERGAVGVDVERERVRSFRGIAADFFAPAECEALAALPDEAVRERFFALWTLKEAYIKARGMGLALPLDRFAFHFEPGRVRLCIDPALGDRAALWHFFRRRPTPEHQLALAVRARRRPRVVGGVCEPHALVAAISTLPAQRGTRKAG